MKLEVKNIGAAVTLPNGVITFPCKDESGATHTIEIHTDAQVQLMMPLLATASAESGQASNRVFRPMGIGVSRLSTGNTGLQFFLDRQVAIHLSLHPKVLAALRSRLDALDEGGESRH